MMRTLLSGAQVFDGTRLHADTTLAVEDGHVAALLPDAGPSVAPTFAGGILAPAFVDLQVNGGGGIMLDGDADAGRIAAICATHILLGCGGILPTLITDTREATARVIAAAITAAEARVPGFLGLHLEGPHLDPRRKGAHDAALIRPMEDADLALLIEAAAALPVLLVTVAPEAVRADQIAALARAKVLVSLGHSDCTHAEAVEAMLAGARCATHLFNAMSQMGSRTPGLVGAVLDGAMPAGLIADGHHVDPATMRVALAARPEGLFLVSDAMALAGTDDREMTLGGRRILRRGGRLTLADGTLAGADLRLDDAIGWLVRECGLDPARAIAMATSVPAAVIGLAAEAGHLKPGRRADMVHLDDDYRITAVWWRGRRI